jgi:thioesterase domain-containing protein
MLGDVIELSVVVPFYEEEGAIDALFVELLGVLDGLTMSSEVIAVDDGSNDTTFAKLAAVRARDPRVKVIRFRRNFGQTASLVYFAARCLGRRAHLYDGSFDDWSGRMDLPVELPEITQALLRHPPQPWAGRMVHIWASDSLHGSYLDPGFGWDHLSPNGFAFHEVSGDHLTMIQEPNIAEVTHIPLGTVKTRLRTGLQKLRELWLDSVQQTSKSG